MNIKSIKSIKDIKNLERIANISNASQAQQHTEHKARLEHFKDSKIRIENKKDVYISCGDINGIGLQLILSNHNKITKWCNPIYCVSLDLLKKASNLLNIPMPNLHYLQLYELDSKNIDITPSEATKDSGEYSFSSFESATNLSVKHNAPLLTLPINKYAWNLAGIKYPGHTQYLRDRFSKDAIMLLGNDNMQVALFTDHIPLSKVASMVSFENLNAFLQNFYDCYLSRIYKDSKSTQANSIESVNVDSIKSHLKTSKHLLKQSILSPNMVNRLLDDGESKSIKDSKSPSKIFKKVALLGLNPHAGDNGVIGKEDFIIKDSIKFMNDSLGFELFEGPLSPDCAFIPINRAKHRIFVAMYHDSGLAPLKALYFDNSINVSLNLPILRVSPDHGTCYDIAYKKDSKLNSNSYLECFKFIILN